MNSYPDSPIASVAVPTRVHNDLEVVLWCRAGNAEVTVEGHTVVVGAGEALYIGTGVEHAILTEPGTVLCPVFLDANPVKTVAPCWSLAPVMASAEALLTSAHVESTHGRITVPDSQRRLLQARVRALFSARDIAVTPPAARTPWIDDDPDPVLLWCTGGIVTVMVASPYGGAVREVRLRRGQAAIVPGHIPHCLRVDAGGVIVPVWLSGSAANLSQVELVHLPTSLRAETLYTSISEGDLRPSPDWDAALPLSLAPTDVTLAEVPLRSLEWIVQRIQHALHDEPGHPATLIEWARHLEVSPRSIDRAFAAHTDFTFTDWRNELRMERAISLLDEGKQAKWVGYHLGFAHPSGFSRAFRRHTGTSIRDHQARAGESLILLR